MKIAAMKMRVRQVRARKILFRQRGVAKIATVGHLFGKAEAPKTAGPIDLLFRIGDHRLQSFLPIWRCPPLLQVRRA
jgi:hypothetical protein